LSIEEKDIIRELRLNGATDRLDQNREQTFLTEIGATSDRILLKPFGSLNWVLFGPLLVCLAAALLFFTRTINLGDAAVNWKFNFNVNLTAGSLVLLVGILLTLPKVIKEPQTLRSQSTLTSIGLMALVTAFFFFGVLNLGTFNYTLDNLSLSAVVGLLFVGAILFLATRGSLWSIVTLISLFLWWGFSIQDFGLTTVADLFTSSNGGRLLRSLTPPKWDYFDRVIDPMMLTVQTAIAATVIGMTFALPLSILAARNTTPHPAVYTVVRFLINTIRAIPALVMALLLIPFVGLGPAAGVLGLGIHSISVLTKLYAEAFEAVKPQPMEALNAVGANGLKTFRWGVFTQAFPLVASYSIFNWESNGRDSTVVAFVGGGGIGFLLQGNLNLLNYGNVAVLLIVLIVTVALLDRFSDFVRSKIL
jgi:phosphonate ABC transporter permease subunit PhnE